MQDPYRAVPFHLLLTVNSTDTEPLPAMNSSEGQRDVQQSNELVSVGNRIEISGTECSVKLPRDEGCTDPLDALLTCS